MSENCSGNCSGCSSAGGCQQKNEKLAASMGRIKHKLLVLSGKGGVGKSTVSASLAITLAKKGFKVGLLDVDFHGPSLPTLFGVQHLHMEADETGLIPMETSAGVRLVSVGLLLEEANQAVIWRGPVKLGVLKQLLEDVHWSDLDFLIMDFPPGTGDEALSAAQTVTGDKKAVIVTTPQELSLADCRKCIDFCEKLHLPIAGMVENMSYFQCGKCGEKHRLFSSGGGERLAENAGVALLGQLPLEPRFLELSDAGGIANALEEVPNVGKEFSEIADTLLLECR